MHRRAPLLYAMDIRRLVQSKPALLTSADKLSHVGV
jgi:hypothetical protein